MYFCNFLLDSQFSNKKLVADKNIFFKKKENIVISGKT